MFPASSVGSVRLEDTLSCCRIGPAGYGCRKGMVRMRISIGRRAGFLLAFLLWLPLTNPASAQQPAGATWTVRPEWVIEDENALAGDALRGRGSATPDEARAAA